MTADADADMRRRQAADWFARLNQREVAAADIKAFSAWRSDPENAAAFDRMQEIWAAAGALARDPAMAALTEEARSRTKRAKRGARKPAAIQPWLIAGAVVLALAGGLWTWRMGQPAQYATAVGERRVVELADGSRVMLDTGSQIRVRFRDDARLVELASGQARFDVKASPERSFTVSAGDTLVTATGTRFDVRRDGAGARVLLVEGQVSVKDRASEDRTWTLRPGQQIRTSSPRPTIAEVDIPSATSWTTGRLIFDRTPVTAAVAEVNRYTDKPIEVRDPEVAAALVSGAFDAGDVEGFAAALRDLYGLEASRSAEGGWVLSSASAK